MICVVVKGPTIEEAYQQISAAFMYADSVELRLDCFISLDIEALKKLRTHCSLPMIFTLRSIQQGGSYPFSEKERLTAIHHLMTLQPDYFDLESHIDPLFIQEIVYLYPEVKIILSYHDFEGTPLDLDRIYQVMQKTSAFYYKIAVTAQSILDALRLMCWAKQWPHKLIAISMGTHGQISRICGRIWSCPITYAALEDSLSSAPGQLTAKILIERYHYHSINDETKIYGLIGNPVTQSISDETHNALMHALGIDAVYVKMQVKPEELGDFFQYARQLSFYGLSVTMPLKEEVLAWLDEIDPVADRIGAVNTLVFQEGKICGFNTDGIGALNAIERRSFVKDQYIVLIGAGGAAKAIAYEADQRGAKLIIVNRDVQKAQELAKHFGGISKRLEEMEGFVKNGYEVIINCTPIAMPIAVEGLIPQAKAMDITTKPRWTEFLKQASERKCQIIFGYEMFVEQALGQFQLWFKSRFDLQEGRKILEKEVLDGLS